MDLRDGGPSAALAVFAGPGAERPCRAEVVTFDGALLVGRRPLAEAAAGATPLVVRDPLLSGRHAVIEPRGEEYFLSDLESRNGTWVDGQLATRSVPLRDGAVLFLGHHVAVFRILSRRAWTAICEEQADPLGPVASLSPVMAEVTWRLRRLAEGRGELLLLGETGVGKEVYARAAHRVSGRPGPFVAINCAAVPGALVESELFGYVRGAHSLAREPKAGLVEASEGGTLFLDEIGDMGPELQVKLLRFAQDRTLTPVGSLRARHVDARLIAATNRVDPGGAGLRLDLLMRLGADPLTLPPLRHRIEDVGPLAAHFLAIADRRLDPLVYRALFLHDWPGNVRELEKAVQGAAALARGRTVIRLRDLPARVARHGEQLLEAGSSRSG